MLGKKISVAFKILILFFVITLVTIGFNLFIGIPLFEEIGQKASIRSTELGEKAVQDSSAALLASAKSELFSVATDKAEIANLFFEKNEGGLRYLVEITKDQMSQPVNKSHTIYFRDIKPDDPKRASLLHVSANASVNGSSDEAYLLSEMFLLSELDEFCIPLLDTKPDIDSIFIGTSTGMIQVYPWTDTLPETYDPRLRPWYIQAEKKGTITWTNPYIDSSSGELTMTTAVPVTSADGLYHWVIGQDVRVETINTIINSSDSSGHGYAFIIDNEGKIISRPDLKANDVRWDESYESENILNSEIEELKALAVRMIQGEKGVEEVTMGEGDKIIAFAPITSTGWSIGVVRPLSSILAPIEKTETLIRNETQATRDDIAENKKALLNTYIIGSIILLIVVSLLAILFAGYITRPIKVLTEATRIIGTGEFTKEVRLKTRDEFEELGDHFNHMSRNLSEVMKTLEKTTAEKERYATELNIAKEIQQSFLPETIPRVNGLDIAAKTIMARQVGGDFFDIFPFEVVKIHTSRLILMIADVSGKGVPAALFMALARIVIRVNAIWHENPCAVMNAANDIIASESKSGMFVTTFYADYDEKNRLFRYVNAGHNPPILFRSDTITTLEGTGPAVGVISGLEYDSGQVDLLPGDLLVLYTDGVTEAVNNDLTLFGEEKLYNLLPTLKNLSAEQILASIHEAVDLFAEGRPQEDDITLMIIKVL